MYKKKIAPPRKRPAFFNIHEGMAKVREGLFAFHLDLTSAYTVISNTFEEHEKCGLQEIRFMPKARIAIPVQKESPYREIFAIR